MGTAEGGWKGDDGDRSIYLWVWLTKNCTRHIRVDAWNGLDALGRRNQDRAWSLWTFLERKNTSLISLMLL